MTGFEFIYHGNQKFCPSVRVNLVNENSNVTDVVEAFETFLRACGFGDESIDDALGME